METALKVGFGKEVSFRSSPTIYFDELWSLNAQNGASSDDFLVDELLDFSNEDGFVEEEAAEGEEDNKNSFFSSVSVSAPLQQLHHDSHENSNQSSSTSSEDDFWSVSSRDFEDLEWLSHIVADSSQEYSAAPSCVFLKENPNNPKETTHPLLRFGISSMPSHLKTPLPSKPRSRRARSSGRVWSLASPSPSSTSSVMYSSSSSCPSLSNPRPNHPHPREKLSAKKPKKKWTTIDGPGRVPSPRRCSHCGVQKTPQWRAGPLGAKSLCNACGVRFKSGRLFPEYRPACSPTFSSELHSNHHRKVLEMRQKKDTEEEDQSRPEVEEENGVNPIGTA